MKLLKRATLLLLIPMLTACVQKPPTSYSAPQVVADIRETATDVKGEFCRGQTPQAITKDQYNAWPDDAKAYAVANVDQWLAAGCRLDD